MKTGMSEIQLKLLFCLGAAHGCALGEEYAEAKEHAEAALVILSMIEGASHE